ncbi:hypothetical protein Wcon_00051 [Wolbachia endosymbiont of Cylisticus convexus]|uniref:transposase n=1 Tax=Wolbachia endosymbiont of Cylisticus convexus TaxID=118728 RepID=UPI000DF69FAA|nr:hypothetical protein Wcon_00051 [Wolbachia endosymbiont of Cylisticus convexus]
MKTTQTRAGKKIKGRKRHIVVDTIWLADVHSASVQDRDGIFLFKLNANLRKFFADQGYIGKLQNHCLLK